MKRDDEWVCDREWGKGIRPKALFCFWVFFLCSVCQSVGSCVRTCDQGCVYVWEEGILPAVFFPEPLPVSSLLTDLKAGVGGFGLGKIQPTRGDGGEEPVFLSLCFHHSLNATINPVHIPPSTACCCISYYLAEVKLAYVHASAGMCVCVLRVLAVFSTQSYQKIHWEMWF